MNHTNQPKRILVKIPGDALVGPQHSAIDGALLTLLAQEIASLSETMQVSCVIGAGNLWRGTEGQDAGIDRATADYMGMFGTVINSLALSAALKKQKIEHRVMSAMEASRVCEPYIRGKALSHLNKNRVCIFAGGSGNPFFTADLAAVLRTSEINAELMLRVTSPSHWLELREQASHLSYDEAEKIRALDSAAIAMARERQIPILLTTMPHAGSLKDALSPHGSIIRIG